MKKYKQLKVQFTNELNQLDFLKQTRKREYVEARAAFYYYLRTYEFLTYSKIQRVVEYLAGWRPNHVTVMHGINNYDMYSLYNPKLDVAMNAVLFINESPMNKPLYIKSVIEECSDSVIDEVHLMVARNYQEEREKKLEEELQTQE